MYEFIYKNKSLILEEYKRLLQEQKSIGSKKVIFYLGQNKNYRFRSLGEGSFGIVFKVTYTDANQKIYTFIAKVMKEPNDEPEKVKKLFGIINSIKDKYTQSLIDKYITQIKSVDLESGTMIFEYLEGNDLYDFLDKKKFITENEFYEIVSKILIAILLLHNKLKYTHRDLKPGNIFYDPSTKKLKLIDFGFSCGTRDKQCFNRYQGTSNYIHPRMNKKLIEEFNKSALNSKKTGNLSGAKSKKGGGSVRSTRIKSKSIKSKRINSKRINSQKSSSSKYSNNTNKNMRFPSPKSQDIFSLVVIIFQLYLYMEDPRKLETEEALDSNIKIFFQSGKKKSNKRARFDNRYNKKVVFFSYLKTIDSKQIKNPLISKLIEYIQTYWNFDENNFIQGKRDKSKIIMLNLLNISVNNVQKRHKNEKSVLRKEFEFLKS